MKDVRLELRLTAEESAGLDTLAGLLGRTRSDAVRAAIRESLALAMARVPGANNVPATVRTSGYAGTRVVAELKPGDVVVAHHKEEFAAVPERVYVLDEETVPADSAGGTRPVAGEVKGVERKPTRLELARAVNDAAQKAVGLEPVKENPFE